MSFLTKNRLKKEYMIVVIHNYFFLTKKGSKSVNIKKMTVVGNRATQETF